MENYLNYMEKKIIKINELASISRMTWPVGYI